MPKTYLQQFYKLEVTMLDGTPYDKEEPIEPMNLICSCLHLDYIENNLCVLKFMIFHILPEETKKFLWNTTPVCSIDEKENILIVTTKNSIYRFIKTNECPFDLISA